MKSVTAPLIPLLLAGMFLLSACIGSTDAGTNLTKSDAVITGIDYRKCASPCCSGYFILIDGEGTTNRFLSLPPSATFSIIPEDLPMKVEIEWTRDTNTTPLPCTDELVVVYSIVKK